MSRSADAPRAAGPGSALPSVVLAGRVNVGKSTLFNRILRQARAVVEATPGVTRDRLTAPAEWAGWRFLLTDTGGLVGGEGDPFAPLVAAQAEVALRSADVVLFVVDARAGLLPADRELADRLRRLGRPVVVVANKCDGARAAPQDFYALGLGEPVAVSAVRGEGVGDVLDRVVEHLAAAGWRAPATEPPPAEQGAGAEDAPIAVAFVGRPNVGKSSLVNRLLGEQRLIVSEIAGTTRDAVDVPWEAAGRSFVLVDTPGLRRRARIVPGSLEQWVARRSTAAIRRAEVAVLVLDAQEGCTDQDKRIAGLVLDRGRAAVVVLNKADLLPGDPQPLLDQVRSAMPFLAFAPLLVCSARTGRGVAALPPAIAAAGDSYRRRISTAALNEWLRATVALQPPPPAAGKPVRIYYAAQIGTRPPTVALVTNRRGAIPETYARYLENRLRDRFGLEGTPIRWVFRPHRRTAGAPA
jgi:GTP-binding protein